MLVHRSISEALCVKDFLNLKRQIRLAFHYVRSHTLELDLGHQLFPLSKCLFLSRSIVKGANREETKFLVQAPAVAFNGLFVFLEVQQPVWQ